MGYPFVAGTVLTAADLNDYSGMVKVGSFNPVTLQYSYSGIFMVVDVDNVFTSSFKNYRVIMSGRTSTQDSPLITLSALPLGNPSALYAYDSKLFYSQVNSAGGLTEVTGFGSAGWYTGYIGNAGTSGLQLDFYAPYIGGKVRYQTSYVAYRFGFAGGQTVAGTTASSHGFQVATTYSWTDGAIDVYGWNDD